MDETYRESRPSPPLPGSAVEITEDDLDALLDLVATVRFAFLVATVEKLNRGDGARLCAHHYEWYWGEFERGHWRLARGIAQVAKAFALDANEAMMARCNGWIAAEFGLGNAAIRSEVEAWDVRELRPVFQLARAVLLHEDDAAVAMVSELVTNAELSSDDVDTFPLFYRLRAEGRLPVLDREG
ncbi:MAG: hypothetical protein ACYDH5_18835 [Acidimicrobiales bacterium]